jgi:hypothetical protein
MTTPSSVAGVYAYSLNSYTDSTALQTSVGTIMRTSDNETPVGLITAINLHKKKSLGCITEITAYMLEKCSNADTKQKLSQVLFFRIERKNRNGKRVIGRMQVLRNRLIGETRRSCNPKP